MALHLMSDADDKFIEDNLLSSEDWGDPGFYNRNHIQDLSDDLNDAEDIAFNSGLDEEDALSRSSEFLSGISFAGGLSSGDINVVDLTKTWLGLTDEEHHTENNGFPIKSEPLSPPPSSDSSDSSSESSQSSQIVQTGDPSNVHIKLESPPLTPPRDSSIDSPSPPIGGQQTFFTIANGNLPNKVTKSLASGVINGAKKGVAIAPKPINGAMKLPLAPKLEPVSTKTSMHSPTKPTVTIKQIPAAVRPAIVVKHSAPTPTGRGSSAPPPAKQAKIIPVSSHTNIPSPTTQPLAVVTQPCPPDIDVKAWKRQQRMIKNRESACLSRKKKKEYVQELECKAQSMEKEIQRLRSENLSLRSKMETLVKENTTLKKMHSSVLSSPGRTATFLLGIVLIIGFNLSPLSLFNQDGGLASEYNTGNHAGRALLGFSEMPNDSKLHSKSNQSIPRHASIHDIMEDVHLWESIANQSASDVAIATMKEIRYLLPQGNRFCLHQMNVTDTIRLTDVLQFWAKKQSVEQKKSKKEEEIQKKKKKKKRRQPQHGRFRSGPALHVESDERALQLYDNFFQRTYDNLLEALNRRDDTFYVVSFRNDHLLLPATAHNNTHRPKMSLVMPTVTANESMWNTPKDHISMMQIDCEVIDTKVVHVKDHASTPSPVDDHNKTAYHQPSVPASPQRSDAASRQPISRTAPSYTATDGIGYHPRNLTAVNTP
ncbi:cyclic AMP-dependent transcription factor ATF-6 beta-like isoform X1 [Lytechinus pictus]|uniref:cyclic AMP-dependent transcription factor ATF-6 beta-like isoform X1 n=1 Tax=Lytechinus pictus TaxID=7653 RepID=UPI0030BA21CA